MRLPVSALILTLNEERSIERCLSSLAWADEIVVVDGGSRDRTAEICRRAGEGWSGKIRFMERAWTGFRDQRNFSLEQATHDWVLVVDADERCTPELAEKIQALLSRAGGPELRAYKVKRIEYFLGKPIRYGIWNPSYQDRFFQRQGVRYTNDIHEYPVFPKPPGEIHEALEHGPDFGPERFLEKMNRYTTIEARDRVAQGQRTNAIRMLLAFPAMFYKNYVYYGAYRDGFHGFAISLLEGVSRAVRHIKMWQFQSRQPK